MTLPGVEVTGTVPDVKPYYARAFASVVPLRVGGGTRLKILEAMAAGVPVISTAIGAEGLTVRDGENILPEIRVPASRAVPIFTCVNAEAVVLREMSRHVPAVITLARREIRVIAFAVGVADWKIEAIGGREVRRQIMLKGIG